MSSCFFFWETPFDMWIWFSCGHGWLGLHTWWWMIWCHLICRLTTHLIPYWGIFLFQLRFIDLHWFVWSSPITRYTPGWWFAFILSWFSSGAFLESFRQAHTLWFFHDSLMELSQAHRLSYHHSVKYMSDLLYIPIELFSSYQDKPDALVAILGHISFF